MTLEQLKSELRDAIQAGDRERARAVKAQLDKLVDARETR